MRDRCDRWGETGGVPLLLRQVGCPSSPPRGGVPLLLAPPFCPSFFPPTSFIPPSFFMRVIFFFRLVVCVWLGGGAQRLEGSPREVCRNTERVREQESGRAGERETAALASAFWLFPPLPFPCKITRFISCRFLLRARITRNCEERCVKCEEALAVGRRTLLSMHACVRV